ncbi:DUF555 domain-containing protein [Methanopyrus sp.]
MGEETGGDYHVVLEAAWIVYNVDDEDDAINIAIAEAGKRLNRHGLDYVDIDVGFYECPECGNEIEGVWIVAGTALVRLILSMRVFNAESEEHAVRIAKYEIGQALEDVPLGVVEVTPL